MTLALGVALGLGVCFPLLGGGRVFLLDWTIGPHTAVVDSGVLGLNGGLTAGVSGSVVMTLLIHLLGGAATWLPIFLFFPIAAVGAGRLAGSSRWSRAAAGTMYAVNPFVFNRLYAGHLLLLIGYALLPFATKSALRSLSSRAARWLAVALWWAVLTALSPHFAWIFGLVVAGVVVVALSARRYSSRRLGGWFATVVGAFGLMSTYVLLPHAGTNLPTQVGPVSLAIYRTTGDPHLGLFANVLALYGFWRTGPGPRLAKDVVAGWPFLMFAILLVVAVGAWDAMRTVESRGSRTDRDNHPHATPPQPSAGGGVPALEESASHHAAEESQKPLAILLLLVGAGSYLLALGSQGPTGGLFTWAYDHVPFFALMREPQKFVMLLALAYAVFFGWGVERLTKVNVSPRRVGAVVAAIGVGVLLPLSYTPTIFDALAGQMMTSALPSSYQQADTLMGTGWGNILALPWHLYMEYPFTNGRVVANVAPTSFRRNVIAGDNVEAGGVETQSTSPRSAYLQQLFTNGTRIDVFGAMVAPVGVQFVVLAKTVDWTSYVWLARQKDLQLVLDTPSLQVWRNLAYVGVGQRVAKLTSVPDFGGLLKLARASELGPGAVVIDGGGKGPSTLSAVATRAGSSVNTTKSSVVRQLSPVAYRISSGTPGWVAVDVPYQRGWSLQGHSAIASAEGTVLVRADAKGGVLRFTPWGMVRLGYLSSIGTFCVFSLILVIERRQRTSRKPRGPILGDTLEHF